MAMPIDTRQLVRIEPYTVIHERHDVLFTDDSVIGLFQVMHDGVVSTYLRCLVHDDVHAIVFDVRDVMPSLKEELPVARDGDRRGLIAFSARLAFDGAARFRAAVFLRRKCISLIEREPLQGALFAHDMHPAYVEVRV